MGIKDIPADGDTTIKIQKGQKEEIQYEITQGDEQIEADPAPLLNDARANWKKACADWKKELKENNKDNQIITANCGSMKCSTSAMETTCNSTATHKIKVRVK
jgi:hypothetical protein